MNSEPGREKSTDFVDQGPKRHFNNSQGLKKIQEKLQRLRYNIELIFKNIRPQKAENKRKKLKNLGSPFGAELLGKEENFVAANSL